MQALLLLAMISAPPDRLAQSRAERDVKCGAYCLYMSLVSLDVPVGTLAEFQTKLGPPGLLGHSMDQLRKAAEEYGVYAMPVQTSLMHLSNRTEKFACIVLVNDTHFVNVYDCRDDMVYIADPPESYSLPAPAFDTVWNGKALLLSTVPLAADRGPLIWPMLASGIALVLSAVCFATFIIWKRKA